MASAASLKSPWRWRPGRACCCSTNRWPAWARKNPRGCWRCCDNSRAASPFFWSSTTWTRSSRWRIASASWCTAASSPPARRPRSAPMPRCARPISASQTRFGRRLGMADAPLLELRDVETSYGLSRVLFGVSLAVAPGEVVSLMGRNGMGKTTTVRSIMGLTPPASGSIRFAGGEIRHLPAYRVAKLGVGLVPEGRQLFPNLTTRENLVATASDRGAAAEPWTLDRVWALFPRLAERAGSMANLLSGGEQQMLAIGRALMTNPRLLILDEATEGLAPLIREEIWRCLAKLRAVGQSILVIDKNVDALTRIADRHTIIERGRVVWSGNSKELASSADIQHRYLGI